MNVKCKYRLLCLPAACFGMQASLSPSLSVTRACPFHHDSIAHFHTMVTPSEPFFAIFCQRQYVFNLLSQRFFPHAVFAFNCNKTETYGLSYRVSTKMPANGRLSASLEGTAVAGSSKERPATGSDRPTRLCPMGCPCELIGIQS